MNKQILVIIVTYNAMQWIDRCINSILDSKGIRPDIFIIDNASKDGTPEYINNYYKHKNIIFKQSTNNLGFGKANNFGLQFALDNNYQYVYLMNQDAWVYPETIANLISIHKTNPQYGIISPFQLQANEIHLDYNFGALISWGHNKGIFEDFYFDRKKAIYPIPFIMAAHWLISRECLRKVGGFSPTFPHYGEDENYVNRALYHGFTIGVAPNAIGIHDRENRPFNMEKRIYMSYIDDLFIQSNIHNPVYQSLLGILIKSLLQSKNTGSFLPLKYLYKYIQQYKQMIKNREMSKKEKAFLN